MVHALDDERALQLVRDAHELLDSGHPKVCLLNINLCISHHFTHTPSLPPIAGRIPQST